MFPFRASRDDCESQCDQASSLKIAPLTAMGTSSWSVQVLGPDNLIPEIDFTRPPIRTAMIRDPNTRLNSDDQDLGRAIMSRPFPGRGMDSILGSRETTRHAKENSSTESASTLTLLLTPVPSFAHQAPLETSIRSHTTTMKSQLAGLCGLATVASALTARPSRFARQEASCIGHWLNHDYLPTASTTRQRRRLPPRNQLPSHSSHHGNSINHQNPSSHHPAD
jgi:hypothetical protein